MLTCFGSESRSSEDNGRALPVECREAQPPERAFVDYLVRRAMLTCAISGASLVFDRVIVDFVDLCTI